MIANRILQVPPIEGPNRETTTPDLYPTDQTLEKGKRKIQESATAHYALYIRRVLKKFHKGSYTLGSSSEGLT